MKILSNKTYQGMVDGEIRLKNTIYDLRKDIDEYRKYLIEDEDTIQRLKVMILERQLQDERAFGDGSKTTLRKIEELDRIIHYENWKETARELAIKVSYYEDLLKKHGISFLR